MPRASLSTKGQLVIPKAIREHLGLRPGHGVDFVLQDNGDVLVRAAVEDVRALKGCLRPRGRKPVTIEEMNRAIRQRGRAAR